FLSACSDHRKLDRISWSRSEPITAEIATIVSHPKKNNLQSIGVLGYKAQHWRYMSGEFPVEGTWVKVLRNSAGSLELVEGEVPYIEPTEKNLKEARQINANKERILSLLWQEYPELRKAKKILPPQVILSPQLGGFAPFIEVIYFNSDDSDVVQLKISKSGKIAGKWHLGHRLATGSAQVFPGIPDRTSLSEVLFSNLIGDGTLTSSLLKVEADGGRGAFSSQHEFRFHPEERAFNEVQAYYFADKLLSWLKEQYSFVLPFQLRIKVHVGGLVPSNAAFYYQGNIRLGDGDNVLYRNIPQDPSIVIHEVAHAVVQVIAGLPNDKQGGSLNEAYADFITALFLDNPRMAEYSYLKAPFRRNLENNLRAGVDFSGGLYHDSTIVSGTLWEIAKLLDKESMGRLALQSLARLNPGSSFADFPLALREAARDLRLESQKMDSIQKLLYEKGWQ
ncbi:MAG: hypothetical protein KDD35_11775, partial [Bdellovibrionales bacterium]|nr:hypothetical protein [Bdellovibrionales bacterium]